MMILIKEETSPEILINNSKNSPLRCKSNNQITKFCCNLNCRFTAFSCREEECNDCMEAHEECWFRQWSQLSKRIIFKLKSQKTVLAEMFKIQETFINNLRQARTKLMEETIFKCKDQKCNIFIEKFINRTQISNFTGADMNHLFQSISMTKIQEFNKQYLQKYKNIGQSLFKQWIDQIQISFSSLGQEQQKKINRLEKKQTMQKEAESQQPSSTFINSKILQTDPQGLQKTNYLFKELDSPSNFELLFRASQHNFQAQKFHHVCDGEPHTLTIIKTEFNKTIAGYTDIQWNISKPWAKDHHDTSFLLQLDLKQKMRLHSKAKAIFNCDKNGPSFGADIVIADKCNINNDNYCNFPYSYNLKDQYKRNCQESRTALCGSPNSPNFKVIEYEVFRVVR